MRPLPCADYLPSAIEERCVRNGLQFSLDGIGSNFTSQALYRLQLALTGGRSPGLMSDIHTPSCGRGTSMITTFRPNCAARLSSIYSLWLRGRQIAGLREVLSAKHQLLRRTPWLRTSLNQVHYSDRRRSRPCRFADPPVTRLLPHAGSATKNSRSQRISF